MADCVVAGCDRRVIAKGLCRPHYERKKHGRPLDAGVLKSGPPCRPLSTFTADFAFERSIPEPNTGCWLWLGALASSWEYAIVSYNGKSGARVSRLMLGASRGADLPPEIFALHRCDQPSCVNPDHLFEGSNADNMADMVRKGRHRKAYTRTPRLAA